MLSSFHLLLVLLFLGTTRCQGHTATEWERRTIYQVLTDRIATDTSSSSTPACSDLKKYCGGTWKGIENHLDYIAGMGFDALWISPMPENLGDDYHGYAFLDLYTLNPHFGAEESLQSLIDAAHARDMWVMLDVVGNHVAPVGTDYSQVTPFDKTEHYHSPCAINDWNNQTEVELCRLANLPDLDQNNEFVRSTLLEWVGGLKAKYGFDGLRIDTVPEVHPDFWSEFSAAAGVYCVGEVLNGDVNYVAPYQQYMDGVLSYPLYFTLIDVFARRHSMRALEGLVGPSGSYAAFENTHLLGSFVDNHDQPRFLYTSGGSGGAGGSQANQYTLYKNALVMALFTSGIPIVYYGTEQGYSGGDDPANRESLWPNYKTDSELYLFLQSAVKARKDSLLSMAPTPSSLPQVQRYAADNFYSFSRGEVLVCLTNAGTTGGTVSLSLPYLPYESGDVVCNILASSPDSDCATVSSGGLWVTMTDGLPKVFVPK